MIIFYKLSKFEAPSCNGFEISSFLCPNLQRAITQKNIMSFVNFYQVIYSLSSISGPSLKRLAAIFFLNILITKFHYDPLKWA